MTALPEVSTGLLAAAHPRWQQIQSDLRAKIPDPFFRTFIEPLVVPAGRTPEDRELNLLVPDESLLKHIELRYIKIIEKSLRDADFAGQINLLPQRSRIRSEPETSVARTLPETATPRTAARAESNLPVVPDGSPPDQDHVHEYIAPADADVFLEKIQELRMPPGLTLITGANGYGKTTLCRDLVRTARTRQRTARYLSLETFLAEFSLACRDRVAIAWRSEIRSYLFLVIDDFQFLKKGGGFAQEELQGLLDEFESRGHCLVLSSDRPFEELPLSDTLRSRFFSGHRLQLPPPDFAARLAILQKETARMGTMVAPEDLVYLARNIAGDGRKLKSAAQRLYYQRPEHDVGAGARSPADPRRLEALCRDLFTIRLEIAPEIVLKKSAAFCGTTPEAVVGPARDKPVALARHLTAWLCVDLAGLTLDRAARLIGRKDHSCVVHARKKIAAMLEEDLFFRREVEELKSSILKEARQT